MKRPRTKSVVAALLLAGVIATILVVVMRARPAAGSEGSIVTVARDTVAVRVEEVGIIEPFRKVEIKSKVAGEVSKVLVDVGDRVRAQDVLVELDTKDTKQELRLAAARHRVNQVSLDQARRLLGFKQDAHARGVLSDLDLCTVEGDVRRLETQNGVHGAEQALLRDRLDATKLRAPIDGVVLARHVERGELVTPGVAALVDGKPLLVVAQVDKLLVRTELTQIDVSRLHADQAVEVRVDALPDRLFRGTVYRIAAMAQKSERRPTSQLQVFTVDIVVDASQPGAQGLKPGMIADLRVDIDAHENVLTVPLEAIVYEGGQPHLRRIDAAEQESLVAVELGFQNAQKAEVRQGVQEGDRVRVRPADTTARNNQ